MYHTFEICIRYNERIFTGYTYLVVAHNTVLGHYAHLFLVLLCVEEQKLQQIKEQEWVSLEIGYYAIIVLKRLQV